MDGRGCRVGKPGALGKVTVECARGAWGTRGGRGKMDGGVWSRTCRSRERGWGCRTWSSLSYRGGGRSGAGWVSRGGPSGRRSRGSGRIVCHGGRPAVGVSVGGGRTQPSRASRSLSDISSRGSLRRLSRGATRPRPAVPPGRWGSGSTSGVAVGCARARGGRGVAKREGLSLERRGVGRGAGERGTTAFGGVVGGGRSAGCRGVDPPGNECTVCLVSRARAHRTDVPFGSLAYHGESRGIGEPYPRAARVPFTASTRRTADAGDSGRGLASTTAHLNRPPPSSLLRRARTSWHTRGGEHFPRPAASAPQRRGAGPFSHAGRATPTDALAKISHKPDGLIERERA